MDQLILTDTQIWEVASNEAIDLFGNEWPNKRKWWNDRLKPDPNPTRPEPDGHKKLTRPD